MKNMFKFSLLAAAVLAFSTAAFATDTQTASLNVTATVTTDCTISANTLAFGNYFPIANATSPLNGTWSISYTCPVGVTGTILLNEGAHPASGSELATPLRQMAYNSGTVDTPTWNYLSYNLYTDHAGGIVWDGLTGVTGLSGTGSAATVPIYGQVAAGQSSIAGSYTDTVTATITYM